MLPVISKIFGMTCRLTETTFMRYGKGPNDSIGITLKPNNEGVGDESSH